VLTDKFSKAVSVANYAHYDQTRKGTTIPYIAHPLTVASLAIEFGANEDQAIAALLHDAIEDGGAEYEQVILENFGESVLAMVQGCTDGVPDANGEKADWWERKSAYLDRLEKAADDVLLVSGADKLHNARAIVIDLREVGPAVFDRFKAGMKGTLWYYRNLADIFSRRGAPMAKQLESAVSQMEKLAVFDAEYAKIIEDNFGGEALAEVKKAMCNAQQK
jgi:(p)ppGpp synthase/HD superfamily hydrolase